MRLTSIGVLILAFVVGSGCASSRVPDKPPQTLGKVNQRLDGRWARVQRTDGRLIEHVENVQVGVDSTMFYHRLEQEQMTIPTRSVRKIQIEGKAGKEGGFMKGAAPGIVTIFVGTGLFVTGSLDESSGLGLGRIFGLAMIGGGLLIGVVGGASGALINDATGENEWITVYEGPVRNYRK